MLKDLSTTSFYRSVRSAKVSTGVPEVMAGFEWSIPQQRDTPSTLTGSCSQCASALLAVVEHGWKGGHRARIPRRQGWSPRLLSQLGGVRPERRRGDACGAQAAGRPGTCPSPARRLRAPPRAPAPSPQSGRALCGPAPAAPGHAAHWRPSPGGGRWPGAPRQAGAPASPRP